MNISDKLKRARAQKGLTQNELARISGVKQGTISKIERGDQAATTFLVKLARALDVAPDWLESGSDSVNEPPTEYRHASRIERQYRQAAPELRKLIDILIAMPPDRSKDLARLILALKTLYQPKPNEADHGKNA